MISKSPESQESLRVGAAAKAAGVGLQTLHYYERLELLPKPKRSAANYRLYSPEAIRRVQFIKKAQALGFSLDEIALMFGRDGRPRIDRQILSARADELDRTIRKLRAIRQGLRHAAACPARSHIECPTFRRLLRAAASGAIGGRSKKAPPPVRDNVL